MKERTKKAMVYIYDMKNVSKQTVSFERTLEIIITNLLQFSISNFAVEIFTVN